MLWCLPQFRFPKNKRQKGLERATISAPLETMHQHDGASESGIFYLVPNRYGPGKTIVRRPRPPPTSAPLDDDFDAITQGGTTTRGPGTEWGRYHGSRADTAPPLDDDFDAMTYTVAPPRPETVADTEPNWRNTPAPPSSPPPLPPRERERPRSGAPVNGAQRSREGEPNVKEFGNYGEYRMYMNEMERIFGGSVDLELSVQRQGQEEGTGETNQLGRVMSITSNSPSSGRRGMRAGRAGGTPSPLGPAGGRSEVRPEADGPKAGQDYEVVTRRVLEDGPERTVTISTWREQVAREAPHEVDEMSVYYVGADDYATENNRGDRATEVDSHADRSRRTIPEPPRNNDERVNRVGQPSPERRTTPPRKTSSGQTHQRSDEIKNQNQVASGSGSSQSRHQTPPRNTTPHRDPRNATRSPTRMGESYRVDHSSIRSPTPIRANAARMESPPRSSTPNRAHLNTASFHPTQSGSTISSIISTSSVAFEKILLSCEPSLLHISPVLASLGITREEHLRAVSRLTEETRDKQVKEEALRQGVTVMEWAILLDKLRTL